MRVRWLKVAAFALVFLVISLMVPHNSLWDWGFGTGKAEGQSVTHGASCSAANTYVCAPESGDYSLFACSTFLDGKNLKWSRLEGGLSETACKQECAAQFGADKCVTAASQQTGTGTQYYVCDNLKCSTKCDYYDILGPFNTEVQCWDDCKKFNNNQDCRTGTGTGTQTGQIIIEDPGTVAENSVFTLSFVAPVQANIQNFLVRIINQDTQATKSYTKARIANVCPPTCKQAVDGLPKGTYLVIVEALDAQNRKLGIDGSDTFGVGGAPAATQPAFQTCDQCLQDSRNFYCATSSSVLGVTQNIQGRCVVNGANNRHEIERCQPPNSQALFASQVAQCPKPLSCQEHCVNQMYGGFYGRAPLGTVPFGQCSPTAPLGVGIGGQGVSMQRIHYGTGPAVGCQNIQDSCWCTVVNPTTQGGLGLFSGVGFGSATIPGTTEIPKWPGDPETKQNPPAAQLNQLDCSVASDASIAADVTPKLAKTGDTVTVSGEVGKISDTCAGYERTCRKIQDVRCKKHERVLWQSLECNECSAGSEWPGGKSNSCIGEGRKIRWKVTLAIAGAVACAFSGGACVKLIQSIGSKLGSTSYAYAYGTAAIVGACTAVSSAVAGKPVAQVEAEGRATVANAEQALERALERLDAAKAAQAAAQTPAAKAAAEAAVRQAQDAVTEVSNTVSEVVYRTEDAVTAAKDAAQGIIRNAAVGASLGMCVGTILDKVQGPLNPAACISVCGTKYKTPVAASPTCSQGGNVIDFREATYSCRPGSCEGFADKEVEIKVYDSKGELAAETKTRTDAAGKFDYTFTAPQVEGEYSVVIVVPGLRRSASATTTGGPANTQGTTGAVTGFAVRPLVEGV